MGALALTLALLCCFCWISGSVCEFRTAAAQPGNEVTLLCTNFTSYPGHVYWFRLADTEANPSRISRMITSDGNVTSLAGFDDGKFTMTSNNSYLFLNINPVISSDSGLYFCGQYKNGDSVIVSATYLNVEEVTLPITSVILGCVTLFLTLVILCLIAQIRTSNSARVKEQNQQQTENQDVDAPTYAALRFQPGASRGPRPAADSQLETHVVYAATR